MSVTIKHVDFVENIILKKLLMSMSNNVIKKVLKDRTVCQNHIHDNQVKIMMLIQKKIKII